MTCERCGDRGWTGDDHGPLLYCLCEKGVELQRQSVAHADRAAEARRTREQAAMGERFYCHSLHGAVDARAFADGCIMEQCRLYGEAPDADAATRRLMQLRGLADYVRGGVMREDELTEIEACDIVHSAFDALSETCLCAAILLPDGRVIRGHRHHDCFAVRSAWQQAGQKVGPMSEVVQGFLTTRGRFVERAEALALQRAAGWDKALIGGAELTSEDLY